MTKMYIMTWVLPLFIYMLQSCQCTNSSYGCREAERNALFTFKQSFSDPSHKFYSWQGEDCCNWEGVVCDFITRYVVKVDLRSDSFDVYDNSPWVLHSSKLDSSLLRLRYLNYLDLSGNNFSGSPIPKFLGEMNGLKYLNLSLASFKSNLFPPQLGNLTKLQVLDVSQYKFELESIFNPCEDTLEWLSTLSSLKRLYMNGVNLSRVRNLLPILSKLPFLSVLSLPYCQLHDAQLSPTTYSNLTFFSSKQELYLRWNYLLSFPLFMKNMTSLKVLDFSSNILNSSIPMWITDLKDLEHLDLSLVGFNNDEGGLGRILWGLCHLKTFDFSYHNVILEESLELSRNISLGCITYDLEELNGGSSGLTGVLSEELCQFKKLKHIDLSDNALHGSIHALIGNLTDLIEIDLHSNELNDTIPTSLGNLLSLRVLNLWNNHFYGVVPDSIGKLVNLETFYISSNYLTGNISKTHFLNATKLTDLRLGSNKLTIIFTSDSLPPFQLVQIQMESCKIGPSFPRWLETQKKLYSLVLSNASIRGPWPKWFQSLSLTNLDLSHNEISGQIPHNIVDLLPGLKYIRLSDNHLNGTIPSAFCKMESLWELDISRNLLSGEIPNCWEDTQNLDTINLSFNMLTGVIPRSIGNHSALDWLQLNNNRLKGEIPSSLRYNYKLTFLNLADNGFSGNISTWIGGMRELRFFVLRNNRFGGYLPKQLCQMESLQILDVAYNNFTGSIPSCLDNLTAMTIQHVERDYFPDDYHLMPGQNLAVTIKRLTLEYTKSLRFLVNIDLSSNNLVGVIPTELTLLFGLLGLNLSNNHLTGTIPKNIGNLAALESLDLSNNQLSGIIPTDLSLLQFLSSLNLSQNNLSGRIPQGNQLQVLPDPSSIYAGNPNLCGTPLSKRCSDDEPVQISETTKEEDDDEEEDKSDKIWLYLAISIGYAFGLWAFFGILMFKRQWRYAYFRYVDYARDWIYVFIMVNARRLKRKRISVEE